MKKWFGLLFFSLIFGENVNAQKAGEHAYKNEFGATLFSYRYLPHYSVSIFLFAENKHFVPLNGISYKRYFGQHILRASIAHREVVQLPGKPKNVHSEGRYNELFVKAGYEKQFTIHPKIKLKPYAALDVGIVASDFEGYSGGGIIGVYYHDKIRRIGGSLSPTLGLRYDFTKRFSISAETCADFIYSRLDTERIQTYPKEPVYAFSDFKKYSLYTDLVPLSKLSLNVKF